MPARRQPANSPMTREQRESRAAALAAVFERRSEERVVDPYVSNGRAKLARWRARCGPSTPAQVRAWVLAQLAELQQKKAPPP